MRSSRHGHNAYAVTASSRFLNRKSNRHSRTHAQFAFRNDLSAVCLDEVLHDRETKSGPARLPRTTGIDR